MTGSEKSLEGEGSLVVSKYCCDKFKKALKSVDIFHKVQYGTDGTEYSWGYYTDMGERLWTCPFCEKELE